VKLSSVSAAEIPVLQGGEDVESCPDASQRSMQSGNSEGAVVIMAYSTVVSGTGSQAGADSTR